MNIDNIFATMKQKTALAHRQLEATYPFSLYMRGDAFSATHYARSLQVLLAFHCFATPVIRSLPPDVGRYFAPDQTHRALLADLAALPPVSQSPATFSSGLNLQSTETIIAFSYVWMGSSMGGTIISRWLRNHHPDMPTHYYQAMADTGQHWEAYKTAVTNYASTCQADLARCGEAATAVFQSLIQTAEGYPQQEAVADCFERPLRPVSLD